MTYFLIHTVCLFTFWAFYQVFLKKDTFFERNRWYLLLTSLLACLVPLLEIPVSEIVMFEEMPAKVREAYIMGVREDEGLVLKGEQATDTMLLNAKLSDESTTFSQSIYWKEMIAWVYGAGVAITLLMFVVRIGKLLLLIQRFRLAVNTDKVESKKTAVSHLESALIVIPNENAGTFSFFNYLFWDKSLNLSEKEEQQIITHELAHIRGGHSYDLIFMQLQKIVFWFNPLIYLYEKELRNQHEFIADSKALTLTKTEDYISLMVSSLFKSLQIDLTHSFHNQQIKQRIKMLNTQKTSLLKGNAKTVLVVALVAVVAVTFACTKGLESNLSRFAEKNAQMNAYQQELLEFEEKYPDVQVDVGVNEKGIVENIWHEPFSINDVLNVTDEKDRRRIFQLSQELFKNKQKPFYPTQIDENGDYIFPEKIASFNDDLQEKGELNIVFQYPKEALPQKASGEVLIEFVVSTEGKTQNFKVIKPFYGKETALINYFQKKTYAPAIHDGKNVNQKMIASMHYRFFDKNAKKEKYTMQGLSKMEREIRKMTAWTGGTFSNNEQDAPATVTATKID